MRNPERVDRIRDALRNNKWDLAICALPMNVLLLCGYWPVIGGGVAMAYSDGRISLLVPEDEEDLARGGWGFTWCMSGANSALASAAYARSRTKGIKPDDLVLVHCNSYVDGYWTDITRTYCMGEMEERGQQMYETVFAARQAALDAIRPGVRASDADKAAREILKERGFAPQFKHSTGHGVGFSAISAHANPRLHPKSEDTIEAGMVLNGYGA